MDSKLEQQLDILLESLCLSAPSPYISSRQISSNLSTRHRLLHFPPNCPEAPDLTQQYDERDGELKWHPSDLDESQNEARTHLAKWLVTDIYSSGNVLHQIISSLFAIRRHIFSPVHRQTSSSSSSASQIPITKTLYANDGSQRGRIRVDLDLPDVDQVDPITLLFLLEPADEDGEPTVKYENMLLTNLVPSAGWQDQPTWEDHHLSEESRAEYISDPNDFWIGCSDDEQDTTGDLQVVNQDPATVDREKDDEDAYWDSYGQREEEIDANPALRSKPFAQAQQPISAVPPSTLQVEALAQIIQGAYTLFKSNPNQDPADSTSDPRQAFLRFVKEAIDL